MKPGEKLAGRYLVVKTLGAGGFGTTYLAQDTQRPGQPACVVKHLKPDSKDEFILTTARRLFTSEAEILEKLGKHDQIPALLAYFEENGQFYLAQEFIEGHPLSQEIKKGVPWPQEKVVRMLADVLSTLEFVHQNGVIHRDIKPDNLIRRKSDGKLVLIDFGAVKAIQDPKVAAQQQTGATVAIGTVGYAPAEQAQGKPQFASDIYSLGIMAICALTGKEPDQLESDPQTGELLWRQGITVGHALGTVLDRMVRYQYSRRYAHAGEALAALRSFGLIGSGTTSTETSRTTAVATPASTAKSQVRRPVTSTLAPSGGVDGVVWKYGIITVLVLIIMGVLSIPLQLVLNRSISRVEPSPQPQETGGDPPQPRSQSQSITLSYNSVFQTEEVLKAGETHLYRVKFDPEEFRPPWPLALSLTADNRDIRVDLIYPDGGVMENITNNTYELSDAGEYGVRVYGGQGRYRLRLRLGGGTNQTQPVPPVEREEPSPSQDDQWSPRLPGR
ncbi:MAG: serine/threonine-protein kinase [Gloeomargarita sp. HHBFW_bins_162]